MQSVRSEKDFYSYLDRIKPTRENWREIYLSLLKTVVSLEEAKNLANAMLKWAKDNNLGISSVGAVSDVIERD